MLAIVNGYHLPTSLMRLAVRLKGADRLCLVSDALRMATLTPATFLGVEERVGRLAPGCSADVLVLERGTLYIRHLLLGGAAVPTGPDAGR